MLGSIDFRDIAQSSRVISSPLAQWMTQARRSHHYDDRLTFAHGAS